MTIWTHRTSTWIAAWLVTLTVLICVLVPLRSDLDEGTIALVLLFAPLVAAPGGRRVAIAASVVSALAFNYWFTVPLHSLRIADTASIVAFVVYLVLSVGTALLVGLLRQRAVEAAHADALRETDALRVGMLRAVSHDLRTPLAAITASASVVGEVGPVTPDQIELLGDIGSQARRLSHLVDQALDVGRIEGGALVLRRERVGVDELVRDAVEAVGEDAHITLTIDDDVPAIPVDETLIRQVVVNLLTNAIRHGAPPIQLSVSVSGDDVCITVADHGPGLDSWPSPSSSGLGLTIVEGYVRAHDGRIELASTPGGGATIRVFLPIDVDTSEGAA